MNMTLRNTLITVMTAGACASFAFDVVGQAISPILGFAKLAPVGLAGATLKSVFGVNPPGAAFLLHAATGTVFYTIGWAFVARPLQRAILPNMHWAATAVLYGAALWAFALYFMAHLVVGNPPFLGWTQITYVALVGHLVYALVAGWVIEASGLKVNLPFRLGGSRPVPVASGSKS